MSSVKRISPAVSYLNRQRRARRGGNVGESILLKGVHLLTSVPGDEGNEEELRDVLIRAGTINKIGPDLPAESCEVMDLRGCWAVPGLIDACTRMGLDVLEAGEQGKDSDELSGPVQPDLRVRDGLDFNDPAYSDSLLGGVTTVYVGPGDQNVIGGQGAVVKTWGSDYRGRFLKDPADLKAVIGELPRRRYREKKAAPVTRMGEVSLIREFLEPRTVSIANKVLERGLPLRIHAKTARDIMAAARLASEYGVDVILEHALALDQVASGATPRKVVYGPLIASALDSESNCGGPASAASLLRKGIHIALTTDHPVVPVQDLRIAAALLLGENVSPHEALRSVTLYPAQVLGIDELVGIVAPGKQADIAVFSKHPLDITSKVVCVFVQGQMATTRPHGSGEAVGSESI